MYWDAKQFGLRERRTRHTLNSHLAVRHPCFPSCLQKSETSLQEIQLGRAACTKSAFTLSSRENVKRSMQLLEQFKGADADISIVLATSRCSALPTKDPIF